MASKQKPSKRTSAKRGVQCAAFPFQKRNGETHVLLVTSRETKRWVLPKGWTAKRRRGAQQAQREAFEEAGIVGQIAPDAIGSYAYLKRLDGGTTLNCDVKVFALAVERLLDDWPERAERERRWFTISEAVMAVDDAGLVTLMRQLAAPKI